MVRKIEKKTLTPNQMKKNGAYHERNFIQDFHSMLMKGNPDFLEIKYFVDRYYYLWVLTNAMARKGIQTQIVETYVNAHHTGKSVNLGSNTLLDIVLDAEDDDSDMNPVQRKVTKRFNR